jgi:acyl dehydratase
MPMNAALVGKSYPPMRYEVGREKLREFATAVGESDPLYHDEEIAKAAGHPDLPAVPTFPVVVASRASRAMHDDAELGLDYSRVVHGEQEFIYERPVYAGDRLVATPRIDRIAPLGRHEMLVIETAIDTEDGTRVCTTRATLVVRGADPATDGGAA